MRPRDREEATIRLWADMLRKGVPVRHVFIDIERWVSVYG